MSGNSSGYFAEWAVKKGGPLRTQDAGKARFSPL